MRNTCSFSKNSDGGRPTGSSGCKWVDNIKNDHNEEGVDWISLVRDRIRIRVLVRTLINFWVPRKAELFLFNPATFSFPRRTFVREVSSFTKFMFKKMRNDIAWQVLMKKCSYHLHRWQLFVRNCFNWKIGL